jgi:hypothetical protein
MHRVLNFIYPEGTNSEAERAFLLDPKAKERKYSSFTDLISAPLPSLVSPSIFYISLMPLVASTEILTTPTYPYPFTPLIQFNSIIL